MLLSIEAMKMETALHADRDGKIAEVLVKTGDQIDAKDLAGSYSDVRAVGRRGCFIDRIPTTLDLRFTSRMRASVRTVDSGVM